MATSSANTSSRVPALLSVLFALVGTAAWIAVAWTPVNNQLIPAHTWAVLEFFIGIGAIGFVVGVFSVFRGRILFRLAGVLAGLLNLGLLLFGIGGVLILHYFPHGLFTDG